MGRLRLTVAFLGVALIGASGLPAAAAPYAGAMPRVPVVVGGAFEYAPAADGDYVAWTANTFQRPGRYNVYFSQGGGPRQRVNPAGIEAETGGIDGTELIYSEFTRDGSDLVLYDMATETVLPTPAGVNTGREEFGASNSGDYLLFDRDRFSRRQRVERIVLHNTVTGAETILAESTRAHKYLASGQVNGNWAVYFKCGTLVCNVFRYDIGSEETRKVPNAGNKQQYASSVSDEGIVYFLRSPPRCGQNVRIMSWDGASDPSVFLDLPDHQDSFDTFFDDAASSLYYQRIRCGPFTSDIFSEPVL